MGRKLVMMMMMIFVGSPFPEGYGLRTLCTSSRAASSAAAKEAYTALHVAFAALRSADGVSWLQTCRRFLSASNL